MKILLCCLMVAVSGTLLGQSYTGPAGDSIPVRIYANAGLFFPNMTTSVRLDSEVGLGTELGLEDDFKFDETIAVFHVMAMIRAQQRSQFVLSYTNMFRRSNFQLDERIQIGDTIFDLGADLNMRFDVNYYAFTWRYSFFNHANWNAGLSLGLRLAEFRFTADATVNGREFGTTSSVVAPAPLIGLHGSGYLTHRLLARYSFEYFGLEISGVDINVLETRASLEYFITENIGLGVAYTTSNYRVTELPIGENFDGRILFAFSGGNVFLAGRF